MAAERSIKGKVAVVTGASRGIGKAVCVELARRGAKLVIAARTESPRASTPGTLGDTVTAIREHGGEVLAVAADLAEPGDVDKLVATALEAHGTVDLLVNNAAYTVGKAIWAHAPHITRDQWDKGFAINVTAPLMLIQGFWEAMRAAGGGVVVNVSSGAASLAPVSERVSLEGSDLGENGPLYGATKAALNRMANLLAGEGLPHRIAIVNVNPGLVLTETMALTFESSGQQAPEHAAPTTMPAKAIAYLCTCPDPLLYTGQLLEAQELVEQLGL